ncbi:hypothetical protein BDR07DRAFT_919782 [Suillus spraguei]|nr:hypothetical protein BDR07DRAFT_919782 [Suillus spraguei]
MMGAPYSFVMCFFFLWFSQFITRVRSFVVLPRYLCSQWPHLPSGFFCNLFVSTQKLRIIKFPLLNRIRKVFDCGWHVRLWDF